MKALETKIKALLPLNSPFTLDDSEQSFVVFPTNPINLTSEFISIEVAVGCHTNITEHNDIMTNIVELYSLLTDYADTVEDYCSIYPSGNTITLNWGGIYIDQVSLDFDNITDLINHLKINK